MTPVAGAFIGKCRLAARPTSQSPSSPPPTAAGHSSDLTRLKRLGFMVCIVAPKDDKVAGEPISGSRGSGRRVTRLKRGWCNATVALPAWPPQVSGQAAN